MEGNAAPPACPGCERLQREVAELRAQVERLTQLLEAATRSGKRQAAPFSKGAATGILFSHFGKRCLSWQNPDPSSATPHHAIYPHVPTLVLEGDLDNRVPLEETNKVADLFPNSVSVKIPEAGHETLNYSLCAIKLMNQFIETRQINDTSCANAPAAIFPAVGRFPLLASQARPAEIDPNGGNQIGIAERKVVTVSVAAATDAMQRSYLGSGDGVGLRAGIFHTDFSTDPWRSTLTNCRFATDVVVNGTVTWAFFSDSSFVADLVVSGLGTAGGTLSREGIASEDRPRARQERRSGFGRRSLHGLERGDRRRLLARRAPHSAADARRAASQAFARGRVQLCDRGPDGSAPRR